MDGKLDIFTLIFVVLAVVIILKLRSVLGRRTNDDDARQKRYDEQARAAAAEARDKVVMMPRRQGPTADTTTENPATAATTVADAEQKIRAFAAGNMRLAEGLLAIHRADASFDPEPFMRGSKQAYEMIVTAFAEGNRKTLRNLLSREVYEGFVAAITERESRGDQIDQSFVGINKADLIEAELKKDQAQLSVKFVSELITATRDKAGTVLAGDPKKIKEVIDIWTFARETGSRDPNWKLVATQAPN